MACWHTVKPGETVSFIADFYRFRNYKTVYNHPENKELRSKRLDPDIVFPGDQVFIPDLETKSVACATDMLHKFVVQTQYKVLRIRLQDYNGNPLFSVPYQLQMGLTVLSGTTDDQGVLETRVPVRARQGTLTVESHQWTINIGELNPISETTDLGATGIQQRLLNLGFDPGPIDGVIGKQTEQAIRGFQSKHPPLAVDGQGGPATIERLMKEHGS